MINFDKDSIEKAANTLRQLALRQLDFDMVREYQNKYKEIIEGYRDSDLVIYSSIKLDKFEPFLKWLPSLVEKKAEVLPLIIANMLKRDIYAENIYRILQIHTNSENQIIWYNKLHEDKILQQEFKDLGGAHDALAVLNAFHWLSSEEAADIVKKFDEINHSHNNENDLCAVNGMLGVSNNYIDCAH
jgi:CRISPR/Cas system-associated endonuclease/helicase Cas3